MTLLKTVATATLSIGLFAGAAYGAESLTLGADGNLTVTDKLQVAKTVLTTGRPPVAATPVNTAPAPTRTPLTAAPMVPQGHPVAAAAMPRPGTATSNPQAPIVTHVPYRYMARTVRSPFVAPEEVRAPTVVDTTNLPDLRRHPLGDFTLVGIVWSPNHRVAMVSTPSGKGYSVRVGTRIGAANGRVRRISRDAVIIEERRTDVFGETKKYETVLALRPEEAIP